MALTKRFVEVIGIAANGIPGPLVMPWPMPGNLGGFVSFDTFAEWQRFALQFGLREGIPAIVSAKFDRAQKLFLLTWLDFDLIKAAELLVLTALELALQDRYGPQAKKSYGNSNFAHLLRYMPEHDGLTDDKVAMNVRCKGGTITGLLTGERTPDLADIRNDLAHGYPFDGFPCAGLFELVRDLIEYAYRDFR